MRRKDDDFALIVNGVLDVVLAFAITLERRGLLTRVEIADTLRIVKDQRKPSKGDRQSERRWPR